MLAVERRLGDNRQICLKSLLDMVHPSMIAFALRCVAAFLVIWVSAHSIRLDAAEPPSGNAYLDFVRQQAAALRAGDRAPVSLEEWNQQRARLREKLVESWGGFPEEKCSLDPQKHGEIKRAGYRVEKITFQTRPGIRMTANAYVPEKPGKNPAILMVHGHWRGAKQDPVVQARCIGAAKLGFFVLCVDAFGAGERGLGKALGEYHGEMVAATLLPVGLPLSGLQVYENMRAVDYLLSRPEVDGKNIGITGASGGGNQSMYAGAFDERIKAVVPVCSVGNYQAYLGAACCMCEVVPGALSYTEEAGVLALVAPRALLVINATRDGRQFSVPEAKKSISHAEPVFKLYQKLGNIRHAIFESPHDYSQAMRETMYGWMTKHLKGEGDDSPIPEPAIKTENPEDLRCYPGVSRPDNWVTLPQFAAAESRKLLEKKPLPNSKQEALANIQSGRKTLRDKMLAGNPAYGRTAESFLSEPGITLSSKVSRPIPSILVLSVDQSGDDMDQSLRDSVGNRASIHRLTLRATKNLAWNSDRVGRAPDHTSAEWGLWLGRPLLAQWVHDVRRYLDQSQESKTYVIGHGPAGLVALAAAAADERIQGVATMGSLASWVSDEPYQQQRLGTLVPGILRDLGDVGHLASLIAPRKVVISGGRSGSDRALSLVQLKTAYQPAETTYRLLESANQFLITEQMSLPLVVDAFLSAEKAAIFEPNASLKVAADGKGAGEGPAWDPDLGVLTSGHDGHINRLAPDGRKSIYREKAGTNGLLFDRDGSLIACEPVQRRVTRTTRAGKVIILTDRFEGKKYNQPNDVTVDSKGRIYFSDPRYGSRDDMQQRDASGKTIEGVYRIDPDGKVSRVLAREVDRANGVLVSADDRFLFVADNNNDLNGTRKLWRFALKADGSVDPASKKLLHDWGKDRGPDGLKQDCQGRLYVAGGLNKPNPPAEPGPGRGGISVIDPDSGELLAFLPVPRDEVTNCAFGDPDLKTLYITGGGTLFSIRTTTPGRVLWPR